MKITHVTTATGLFLSMALLLSHQTSAVANQELQTIEQLNRLSRDLAPFPDFFQEGREKFEREIQLIEQRKNPASTEDILKIHVNSQAEIDNLPQFKPKDLQQPQSE